MSKSYLAEPLQDYVIRNWVREPEILGRLRAETELHPMGGYQIPPDQGQLMQLLARLVGAKRYLEVGVFTGYSSLAVMLAMPQDGEAVVLDVSDEFTQVARHYWAEAGVADRIQLYLQPAIESLDWLVANGESDSFDLAFIDADKSNYGLYYERALELVRPNGLILIDNVLWHGRIVDPNDVSADTLALRALNAALLADERIDLALIPIGDGVTVARKRG